MMTFRTMLNVGYYIRMSSHVKPCTPFRELKYVLSLKECH